MSDSDQEKTLEDIDESLRLLNDPGHGVYDYEERKRGELQWKMTDPDGYKKDMEKMCREMFGDSWEVEYQAMLREEFPEEFE